MKQRMRVMVMFGLLAGWASAQQPVRVATYNIKWLSSKTVNCGSIKVYGIGSQGERLNRLKGVVSALDADIIGLQEIRDRKVLEMIFGTRDWTLVMDEDNGECQNLALAVRHPFKVAGARNNQLEAGPDHFLMEDADNWLFPGKRDVLCVKVYLPQGDSLYVMVHHAKSRYGGRHTTDPRRIGAARALLSVLERDFDEANYILLGDFNDNPDDASLNILESGNPATPVMMEDEPGEFLINLTEPLCAAGHVSHGRKAGDVTEGRINTIDSGSRRRNWEKRDTNSNTGDILFDQILVPPKVYARYVAESIQVFDRPVAVEGERYKVASDHLPVFADFEFAEGMDPVTGVSISALLPNPDGQDAGAECVWLLNRLDQDVDLTGWTLMDRADNVYELSGLLAAGEEKKVTMAVHSMPLNNSGDEIALKNADGRVTHQVSYSRSDAASGRIIRF